MSDKKNYFITTPIYYPTDIPHLAAAYSNITADCYARYKRMMGENVYFSTGSDEHGQKVFEASKNHRKTPLEFVNGIVGNMLTVWKKLQISYNDFIRTTDEDHIFVVEEIFKRLLEKDEIYRGEYEGWYCVSCESFWPEALTDSHRCPRPECKKSLEKIKEDGYFFRLSKYSDKLADYLEKNPDFIKPRDARNIVLDRIKNGLQDLCVTRKGPVWGIPVPSDPDFSIYVWFDALINYLSVAGYGNEDFSNFWPADIQVVGRDMMTFHAIIFTAICMALEIEPPKSVMVQGWVLSNSRRISRANAGSVNLIEVIDMYGPDALRFYLLNEVPMGKALEFSIPRLVMRLNNQLANDLGNLSYRSISMVMKYCDGKVPKPHQMGSYERNLARIFKEVKNEYKKSMDALQFRDAMISLWDLVGSLNRYLVNTSPWEAYNNGDMETVETSLYTVLDYLRIITVLLVPFMPRASIKMWRRLGHKDILWEKKFDSANPGQLIVGQEVKKQSPLFPRIQND